MIEIVGRRGDVVLFSSEGMGALVDENQNLVLSVGEVESLVASINPSTGDETATDTASALAEAALTGLNIEVFSNSDRMHTIPKSVVAEAKRGLEWRKEHDRGGTPVGLNTARTLAQGGQIGIKKIRHIAKYFPRHEVDKKGKGYSPGEDGYPSRGRIAWALWGGDAAQRWASAIVERENKKAKNASITAGSYYDIERPESVMLSDFAKPNVQFAARVRKDGTGIDRIYRIDAFGNVAVWDDGCWDDLGHVDSDINTLDRGLDDPYDTTPKMIVPIDAESALAIAAMMDSNPFEPKMLSSIDAEEFDLFDEAESALDWEEFDGLTAAAPPGEEEGYTSEERAENVKAQVRDAKGRFAEKGSRVIINGNPNDRGVIEDINPEKKTATVRLDRGPVVEVPVSDTETEDPNEPPPPMPNPDAEALDTEGILKQPNKEDKRSSMARLPKKLPVIGKEELSEILADFPSMVQRKRDKAKTESLTAAGEEKDEYKDPQESDVDPIYMAIVADDDPQAVMELIALVPASANSNSPSVFRRSDAKWQKSEEILQDLNSPTPPPVVKLDQPTLEEVIKQVDSAVVAALLAAGGADRNRGGAEKLRRYWLYGKGAAKIRWNTPGDWTRCVRNLSKYMGPRAKGYCALRHKEATGMWAGDKRNRQKFAMLAGGKELYSDDVLLSTEEIIEKSITKARIADAKRRVLTAGGSIKPADGGKFYIPLVIPEGMESGDGRIFDKGAITIRELPLPLLWQIKTADGHAGSVVVGRIDRMERTDDGIGNAHGVFDKGEFGKEAERLVRGGFIRGVSADLDKFEADEEAPEVGSDDEDGKIGQGRIKIRKARVMAVTLVPKPAFQECTIQIENDEEEKQEDEVVPDGVYVEGMDPIEASAIVACGMIAGAIPNEPPADWFENPKLKQATPLTVDESGRVFGHIAAWHVDHIGMSFGTKPPRSRSKYAYFHTGIIRTSEGTDVPVGQLTLAGGHASLEMSAQQAVRHYDDTASAFADVHAGEDAYGIWVAGALRPGTTPEQVRAIRASAPSGDWRPIKGHLELVAVCQVNVPGFPIARARVASGAVMALVAAGAQQLAHMKNDPISEMNDRLARLEQPLVAAADDARARVLAVKAEELATKVRKTKDQIVEDDLTWMTKTFDDGDETEAAIVSRRLRMRLAKEGKALPDGSYPIRNASDLKNAIQAYGRAGAGKKAKVRRHIVKRARGLGRTELIPENWKEASSMDEIPTEGIIAAGDPCWEGYVMVGMKTVDGKEVPNCVPEDAAYAEYATAEGTDLAEFKYFSPEQRQKLAEEGKALPDGSFPIENDRDLKNAIWAFGRTSKERRAEVKDHITKRAKELGKEDMLPEIWEGQGSSFSADNLSFSMREKIEKARAMIAGGALSTDSGALSDITSDHSEFISEADLPKDLTPEEIEALKIERMQRARRESPKADREGKYVPGKTQPRDAAGKFRTVLARLKSDLGDAGLDRALEKVEEIENLDFSGDYGKASEASDELIGIIDRLDAKALNPESLENVRESSRQLGEVIANLPFAFGEEAQKVRFSDLPPALRDLVEDMIKRVEAKIGPEDAAIATKDLKEFMSGNEVYNQSEISGQMAKLLRLLT